jgi:hypothetical protein
MFLPANIDLAQTEKYTLSIRLIPDGFSFSIHCPTDKDIFCYKTTSFNNNLSYFENIKKLIFDFEFFTQPFKTTRVSVVSKEYTLVPEIFYEEKKAKDIFDFNITTKNETVLSDKVAENDFYVLFSMDDRLHSFLFRSLWNPIFTHHISQLLSYFSGHHNKTKEKRCYVNFHENLMDVCCFSQNKLLSANTFPINDKPNALYFIVGVWEKLPLNQSTDRLYLTGNTDSQKETVDTLKKLIKKVEILPFSPDITVPKEEISSVPLDVKIQLCE